MKNFTRVILQPKKDRSLRLKHPWVFSGAIGKVDGDPSEGEIVEVFSNEGEYLATGHFHNGSIKVRLFSFEKTDADESFWFSKLNSAFLFRSRLGIFSDDSTNMYRLVHGEADGLPGLIIDIYGSTAVIQTHTLGMHLAKAVIVDSLKKVFGESIVTIYDKSSETMGKQLQLQNEFLYGNSREDIFKENKIQFHVNWTEGQKTGFFLDQRENRKLLQKYSRGKKVLNTFSYSGGFSMYALEGGAEFVHSIDSSKKAAEMAGKNAELNGFESKHSVFTNDVFEFLKKSNEQYDIVVLDPPAFAKHLSAVENAMVGYRNLNSEGMKRLAKGGMLFTFSCSQVIDKVLFRKLVFQAAAQSNINLKIIHQLSQGPDHPISIYHPEGEYLKGLVLIAE